MKPPAIDLDEIQGREIHRREDNDLPWIYMRPAERDELVRLARKGQTAEADEALARIGLLAVEWHKLEEHASEFESEEPEGGLRKRHQAAIRLVDDAHEVLRESLDAYLAARDGGTASAKTRR